ncbi:MAG: hypothetical protein HY013_13200 [Candidatus Solibacter usitatus]|nr:hypothetical protein [Candidatus Solibacter usitatus]
MPSSLGRTLLLAGVALALFGASVIVLINVVPGPHTPGDYLIMGCLATLVALLALFLIVIATSRES